MALQQPLAILWDMDGTIVDTEPSWIRAEKTLLAEWGAVMRPEDVHQWVGIGLWDLATVFQERGVELSRDEIVSQLEAHVTGEILSGELDWRPGAQLLAIEAHRRGITNVLVTMSTNALALRILSHFPEGVFSGVIAGDAVTQPKPHPEPYLRGAELAKADPKMCVAIEDSTIGATSAYRAGAFVIGVPHLVDLTHAPVHHLQPSLEGFTIDMLTTTFTQKDHHD